MQDCYRHHRYKRLLYLEHVESRHMGMVPANCRIVATTAVARYVAAEMRQHQLFLEGRNEH